MKLNRFALTPRIVTAAAASLAASTAFADLTSFVTNSSESTHNQEQTGAAVQRTCTTLAPIQQTLTGAARDLFLRCNEMVQTALDLEQGSSANRTRSLGYTTDEELLATVQQVSGEELAAQGTLSTQVSSGQFANIGGRLNALRLGTATAMARGHVAALTPMETVGNSMLLASTAPADAGAVGGGKAMASSPWGWFTEGGYSMGDQDQTDAEDEFDFDAFSLTAGVDYNFGTGVVGASLGYDHYEADFDTAQFVSGGDVKVKGISGSLFGALFAGNWNLNAIASYGKLDSDVSRRVSYDETTNSVCTNCGADRTMTGDPDGDYYALGTTAGYDFGLGKWMLSPTVSLSYQKVKMDGYDEEDSAGGGLALRYDDQTIKSFRSIVGVDLSIPVSKSFGVLTPSFKAEWHHEFEDDRRTLRAKYLLEDTLQTSAPNDFGCSISCFALQTDAADADFGVIGVGLTALYSNRLQSYVYYETLVGASDLTSHSFAVGLRGQF